MFDSILQPPAGVLPVQHEFVTVATDHFSSSEIAAHEMTCGQDGAHLAKTQQWFGALDNVPPTAPKLSSGGIAAGNIVNSVGATDGSPPPPVKLAALVPTPTVLPTFDFGVTDGQTPPPPAK